MSPKVIEFLTELEKYEADGTDSMDWAEWTRYGIDKAIVQQFNAHDWNCLREIYLSKSDNMKSLIVGHIHLNEIDFADIQLQIVTEMVQTEQIDVAFEALMQIVHGFVTAGTDDETNAAFYEEEHKGVFLTESRAHLIHTFFTNSFINRATALANECGKRQKDTILQFLKLIGN